MDLPNSHANGDLQQLQLSLQLSLKILRFLKVSRCHMTTVRLEADDSMGQALALQAQLEQQLPARLSRETGRERDDNGDDGCCPHGSSLGKFEAVVIRCLGKLS